LRKSQGQANRSSKNNLGIFVTQTILRNFDEKNTSITNPNPLIDASPILRLNIALKSKKLKLLTLNSNSNVHQDFETFCHYLKVP